MFETPSREEINDIIARAQKERARTVRRGVMWIGRKLVSPFRAVLHNPNAHRS
ncbi:MAG: hypothetical protein AAGF88_02460 [Pseudomonadota bacterium]